MTRYRFDAIERMDDGIQLNAFFSRQLEHIRPQIFEIRYPELKARRFVPVNNTIHHGAEEYTYRIYDHVGQAAPIRDYSKDFPRVDVQAKGEVTQKIRGLGDSYGWNIQEARAAMFAGLNLDTRKAKAARDAIEREIDEVLLMGSTKYGVTMEGLFTLSGTLTHTLPNGASGKKTWEHKTPDEILKDLHAIPRKIVIDSKELEIPNTMILPLDVHGDLTTRRMGDADARTILAKFLADDPYIKSVETSFKLQTAGAGNTRRTVCYRRDPEKLEALIPQEFEQFPPQWNGMEVVTHCHARIGGVVLYYPKSVCYADGM